MKKKKIHAINQKSCLSIEFHFLVGMALFILTIFFSTVLSAADEDNSNQYFTLKNGLKILLVKRDRIPLVNIAFAINVGTKDEPPTANGIVHLLEHLILLGSTEKHSSQEMSVELRKYGAHFNAHTNHDLMTFECSLPAEHWEITLRLLEEKIFHMTCQPEDIEKEKKIILKEMAQNNDDPYKRGMELAMQALFKNHVYEKPLAGNRETLSKLTIQDIETFYKRFFIPANTAMAVVGDMDIQGVNQRMEPIFGGLSNRQQAPPSFDFPMVPQLNNHISLSENMDIGEARLIIGFQAPASNHPDNIAVDVFDQIIGKGFSPLLSGVLVKRGKRLSYNVSTSYISLTYGGVFLVFLTVEPEDVKFAQAALFNFFNKNSWQFNYAAEDYPTDERLYVTDYLATAKSKMKFDHEEFQEQGINAALSYARYILFNVDETPRSPENKQKDPPSYMEQLEKISSPKIRDVASQYFSGKKHLVITLLPNKKKTDEPKK